MSADIIAQDLAGQARALGLANAAALAGVATSGLSPAAMAAWNRAKARVLAGAADAVVAFVGDSTTVGHGAGDDPIANFTNARARSMPARVAQRLTALGLPAVQEAVFGGNTIDAASATLAKLPLYNPQLAIASSGTTQWYLANEYSVAGRILRGAAVGAAFALTPAAAFDTIDVYYARGVNASGSFTVDIGGPALATISYTSSSPLTRQSVATGAAPATGTITVKPTVATGAMRLIGLVPRNSALRRVQALNLGWEGAMTIDWASDAASVAAIPGYQPTSTLDYNPLNALLAIGPDLAVIKLGANDLAHSVPVATSMAALQTMITALRASGASILLVTPTPMNPASRDPLGQTAAYNAALAALAASNGCGLLDLYGRYGNWAAANGLGYFADDVHSLPIGYANEGDVIARALFQS